MGQEGVEVGGGGIGWKWNTHFGGCGGLGFGLGSIHRDGEMTTEKKRRSKLSFTTSCYLSTEKQAKAENGE